MIVYSATRGKFTEDVFSNVIEGKILAAFERRLGQSTSRREIESWKNSMQYMNNVLLGYQIPEDAGVAIEYRVPLTAKRVDFDGPLWLIKPDSIDESAAFISARGSSSSTWA